VEASCNNPFELAAPPSPLVGNISLTDVDNGIDVSLAMTVTIIRRGPPETKTVQVRVLGLGPRVKA